MVTIGQGHMYPALTWAILPDTLSLALTVACWCTFGACPNIHVLKERPLEWLFCMQLCVYCTGFDLSFHLSQKLAFQHQIWPRYNILRACIACLELGRDASETVVAPAPWKCCVMVAGSIVTSLWLIRPMLCPEKALCIVFGAPHSQNVKTCCAKILRTAVRRFSAQLCEDSSHSCAKILCTAHCPDQIWKMNLIWGQMWVYFTNLMQ